MTRSVRGNRVVEDVEGFEEGSKVGVHKGVKVGVKGVENRDRAFVSGVWLIDESAAGCF